MGYNQVLEIAQQLSPAEQQRLARVLMAEDTSTQLEGMDNTLTTKASLAAAKAKEELAFIQDLAESLRGKLHAAWGDDPQKHIDEIRESFGR